MLTSSLLFVYYPTNTHTHKYVQPMYSTYWRQLSFGQCQREIFVCSCWRCHCLCLGKNFLCRVCGPLCFLTCNFFVVVVARRISGLLLLQHVVAVFLHFVALQGSVEHLKTTFTFVYATLYAAPPPCHAHLQPGGAAVYNTKTHTQTLLAWPTSAYRRIAEAPSRTSFPLRLKPAWKSQFFHMSLWHN